MNSSLRVDSYFANVYYTRLKMKVSFRYFSLLFEYIIISIKKVKYKSWEHQRVMKMFYEICSR